MLSILVASAFPAGYVILGTPVIHWVAWALVAPLVGFDWLKGRAELRGS